MSSSSSSFTARKMRGPSSKKRKQPRVGRGGTKRKTKDQAREKDASSPSIDKYLKAHVPTSPLKDEADTLVKEGGEKLNTVSEEERQPSTTNIEKEELEHVDSASVELKPHPKLIRNEDTRIQQEISKSSKISTQLTTPLVAKEDHKDTKTSIDAGGKRKGGARGKRKTKTTRAADGDFVPPSSVSGQRRRQPVQQSIRDHFPVRRSTRKPKAILESEKFDEIAEKLLGRDESGLEVVDAEGKGRGVVSTRHFARGELICEYSGELISYEEAKDKEEMYSKDESVGCYMYYFDHKGKKLCVDATEDNGRMGRLLNHSKTQANVVTKLYEVKGQPFLCLIAARDIKSGEELQYDYGERSRAVIESHPWLAA